MIFNLQNEIYRLKAVQKSDSYKWNYPLT
jgi:hypothetical protein